MGRGGSRVGRGGSRVGRGGSQVGRGGSQVGRGSFVREIIKKHCVFDNSHEKSLKNIVFLMICMRNRLKTLCC